MGIGTGLYMYDVVVEKFTFAISSPDEFSSDNGWRRTNYERTKRQYSILMNVVMFTVSLIEMKNSRPIVFALFALTVLG